jgi:hypothetical protein
MPPRLDAKGGKTAEDKALAAQKVKCKRYFKTIGIYTEPTLFLYLPYL